MAQAGNAIYDSPRDIPAIIPIFPLEEVLLLPRTQMPLNIFEPRYVAMIDHALRTDRLIGMIQPATSGDGDDEESDTPELQKVGCLGRITAFGETGDGSGSLSHWRAYAASVWSPRSRSEEPFRLAEVDCEDFTEDLIRGLW